MTSANMLCSDADLAAGDDPRGSAATFSSFLLIEHPTSFGREAADDAIRAVYGDAATAVLDIPGFRPFAIRQVGRTDATTSRPRFAGRTGPASFLSELRIPPAAAELAELSTAAARPFEPLFAVCTNGSRDRCCAVKGRDLAGQLHLELDDPESEPTVVEISHLGGHRFAPTMLVLPWGYSYARLDLATACEIAYAAQDGLVHPANLRGRADLSPAAQVADVAWRTHLGPAPIHAVQITDTTKDGDSWLVSAIVEGWAEQLRVRQQLGPVIEATACGGKPIGSVNWQVGGRDRVPH